MVPSWTETLLEAGLPVVGRTRFCIHPQNQIKEIPAVGGTKDIDWKKVEVLGARYIILDKDENPENFYVDALKHGLIPLVTHVFNFESAATGLTLFAETFSENNETAVAAESLRSWASAYLRLSKLSNSVSYPGRGWVDSPFIERWIKEPSSVSRKTLSPRYLIWKNPWMEVSRSTFIGDVASRCGFELPPLAKKYPVVDLATLSPESTVLLLSSEPFPFRTQGLTDSELEPYPRAIVNGESASWFGIRTLRFLQTIGQDLLK
jgi:hypothetical protein